MHQECDDVYFILKKPLKLSQKPDFLVHFERFLVYVFLRPMSYTSVFRQIKLLMEVHNCGKFHWCSICGCQAIDFQMFLWRCSIHEMVLFGDFLGLFSTKYSSSLLKFWPEVVSHKKKTVFEQSFKISCLAETRCTESWLFWSIVGRNLPLENTTYCQKQNVSQELNSHDYQITQVPGPK